MAHPVFRALAQEITRVEVGHVDLLLEEILQSVSAEGALVGDDATELGAGGIESDHGPDDQLELLGAGPALDLAAEGLDAVADEAEHVVDGGAPQGVFGGEVVVDERLGDSGPAGDVGHGGAFEAVGRELLQRDLQDALASGAGRGVGRPVARDRRRGAARRLDHAPLLDPPGRRAPLVSVSGDFPIPLA